LWQGPLIVFASMLYPTPAASALAAVASLLVSMLTYRRVEQAFRSGRADGDAKRRAGPAAASIYCGALLICAANYALIGPVIRRVAAPIPLRATSLDKHCERQRGILGIKPCVYGEDGRPKVLLVGDSHAGAISQAVIDAADLAGWQSHIATASACAVPE